MPGVMKILAVRKKQLNPEIARSKNKLERVILISEQKVNFRFRTETYIED
jgi:hypothetical protein